jgi:type II secretory pathway component PulF
MPEATNRERATLTGAFAAAIAWQLYVAIAALRYVPRFSELFTSLGAEVPLPTRLLLLTYRGWVLVPVVFTVLAIRAVQNETSTPRSLGVLVAVCGFAALLLQAWLYESCFGPMFELVPQVG